LPKKNPRFVFKVCMSPIYILEVEPVFLREGFYPLSFSGVVPNVARFLEGAHFRLDLLNLGGRADSLKPGVE